MLQEKKLRIQEEQNLTSALITEGRGLLDAAAAPANASGEALAVSPNSAQPRVSREASPAMDQGSNQAPALEAQSLSHWTTREGSD